MSRHLVAAIQMNTVASKPDNVAAATRLVGEAVDRGASLVALPELFNCLADPDTMVAQAESIPGPTSNAMSELAARFNITLVAGSLAERTETGKIFNTSLLIGPEGKELARYRKLHLFDIDLPGEVTFKESRNMEFGDRIAVTETRFGPIAQATCYDLRFPELFRVHVDLGAKILVLPAAFTMATGRDHWEILLRARAIENQMYVIAPNQSGHHANNLQTYGRSLIIDPWGTVLATAPDGEGVIIAEIDLDRLASIRSHLPCLQHRRNLDELSLVREE